MNLAPNESLGSIRVWINTLFHRNTSHWSSSMIGGEQ